MQVELKALQRQVGITFLFVTHDQQEALSMSDRVCVFDRGRVEQIGTPEAIYERPASAFVAGFVGATNIVEADIALRLVGERRAFSLRPERIRIGGDAEGAGHSVAGTVASIQYHGASTRLEIALDGGGMLIVDRPNDLRGEVRPAPGAPVLLSWPSAAMQPLGGT
jgi:putative spermidine/putrescine transport system ATP-binding protein